jgi:hypothetical protein
MSTAEMTASISHAPIFCAAITKAGEHPSVLACLRCSIVASRAVWLVKIAERRATLLGTNAGSVTRSKALFNKGAHKGLGGRNLETAAQPVATNVASVAAKRYLRAIVPPRQPLLY